MENEKCFLVYKINGIEQVNDLQALSTAKVNALDIMHEIQGKVIRIVILEEGHAQSHEITILEAVPNDNYCEWGGSSSKSMPGDKVLFRFECKYE
jgi:hypothetical protein